MIIRSRFSSRCSECQQPILEGDLIHWDPNRRGRARHVNCTWLGSQPASEHPQILPSTPRHQTQARHSQSLTTTPRHQVQEQHHARVHENKNPQETGFWVKQINGARVELAPMNLACPYCKDVFNEISGLVKCVKCSAHYHHECFQENRKCAIYGCISTQTISVGSKRAAFNETIIENTTVLSYQSNDNKAFAIFTKTILVIAVVLFVLWLVMAR